MLAIRPGPIIAYNGAHLVVSLVLGLVIGELTYASVRLRQQMWYLVTMLVILVLAHLYVALWVVTQPVRSALPVWMITAAGLIAVVAMAACLLMIYLQQRGDLVERDA